MPPLSEWQPMLEVQAEAATLTGLVFVAASINLKKIMEIPGLPSRAAESVVQFMQVFFIATAALVPRQSTVALAWEITTVSGLSWVLQFIGHFRYVKSRSGHPKTWLLQRVVQTQLATIPLVVGAAILFTGDLAGIYWLVPGFAFSFLAALLNSWILLVEILR